jgi:PDZ domain
MKRAIVLALSLCAASYAQKTYNHASEYQVAVLDENARVSTGADATLGKTSTDAKLDRGGQGFHFLHTDHGNYRVEAPVNRGASFLSALGTPNGSTPITYHNKWFLDSVPAGTTVLFAAECTKPSKKHPNDTVRCEFWFPDPDSSSHEYRTLGDFTPYLEGNGSNIQKAANSLCGTGKLSPATERQICSVASTEASNPSAASIRMPAVQPAPSAPFAVSNAPSPTPTSITAPAPTETDPVPNLAQHAGVLGVSGANWNEGGMGGVEILEVAPQSAAQISGLRKGNVITTVNGRKISSTQDLAAVLAQNVPGSKIAVTYLFRSNLGWMPEETIVVLTK